MPDLIIKTSPPIEEIEENLSGFDLTAGLEQTLREMIAYKKGEPVPGMVIREYTLSDEDGSVVDVKTTTT